MLISTAQAEKAADKFRALTNTMRLRILCYLVSGERTVGEIDRDLALKQPTLSQQLAELRQSGLVTTRRNAKSIYYRLADERAQLLVAVMQTVMQGSAEQLKDLAASVGLSAPVPPVKPNREAACFAVSVQRPQRR
jgi:DNA-binding transcriptional ArsR family regulator